MSPHHSGGLAVGKKRSKSPKTGEETGIKQSVMVSPLTGAVCPTGAHPGNTGGKPGRSGRKPDAIRAAFAELVEEHGVPFARQVLSGVAMVKMRTPDGKETETLVSASVPDRARVLDIAGRHALSKPDEDDKWFVRPEVVAFLAAVERSIRHHAPDKADQVIADVQATLKAEGL